MVAHWPAVQALQPIVQSDGERRPTPEMMSALAVSLGVCIARGPKQLSLDPQLLQLFGWVLDRVTQVSTWPWFAVVLANSRAAAVMQPVLRSLPSCADASAVEGRPQRKCSATRQQQVATPTFLAISQDDKGSTFPSLLVSAIHGPLLTVHLLLSGRLEGMLGEVQGLSGLGVIDSDAVSWLQQQTHVAMGEDASVSKGA